MRKVLLYPGEGPAIFCPACRCVHCWSPEQWDGDTERPTMQGSLAVRIKPGHGKYIRLCHSRVTKGVVEYLPDSGHEMAGQRVELPEI